MKKTIATFGFMSILIGIIYYCTVRAIKPSIFNLIVSDNIVTSYFEDQHQWLPSFLHTFGFTCLLSSFTNINFKNMLLSGAFWFVLNLLWELSALLNTSNYFHSSFDTNDIIASAIGAILPLLFLLTSKQFLK